MAAGLWWKTDSAGNFVWGKNYGGSSYDAASDIKQTPDGGYIVAGFTESTDDDVTFNHGGLDYWVLKLDSAGNLQWQKTYGGKFDDLAWQIQLTDDGGYIVAGGSYSNDGDVTNHHGNNRDFWIVKITDTGTIEWENSYGGSNFDFAYSIQQTTDNGYIVGGATNSTDGDVTGLHGTSFSTDYWVIKLNTSGKILWQKTYGGSSNESLSSLQQTTDGGYVLAGYTNSKDGDVKISKGNSDYWIVKTDSAGKIKWEKSYGGSASDQASDVKQTSDGGYIVTGSTQSKNENVKFNHGFADYWILKLSVSGDYVWEKSLGGSSYDASANILQTTDGGYITAGLTTSSDGNVSGFRGGSTDHKDFWVVKLAPEKVGTTLIIHADKEVNDCSAKNIISCSILNNDARENYTVKLYRYGVVYDSSLNVTDRATFSGLSAGAYYAIATSATAVSYSKKLSIIPPPPHLSVSNITYYTAQINWAYSDCAEQFALRYRQKSSNLWETVTVPNYQSSLEIHLEAATTYVVKIASLKYSNGIRATGNFNDSIIFRTLKSPSSASTQSDAVTNRIVTKEVVSVTPNPASSYFIINYNSATNKKANAILYDVNGKAVWTSGLISTEAFISKKVITSQLPNGVYYLKLMDDAGTSINTKKIIISR